MVEVGQDSLGLYQKLVIWGIIDVGRHHKPRSLLSNVVAPTTCDQSCRLGIVATILSNAVYAVYGGLPARSRSQLLTADFEQHAARRDVARIPVPTRTVFSETNPFRHNCYQQSWIFYSFLPTTVALPKLNADDRTPERA
ncbi:hypothetical protein MIND_01409500 [Mycena indigotica]|uniref:Uncharacterized protein n=1 Tax=Mycena indigotica TaxID=2126181 RepID=A0A8H6VP53_9AGAR|nr:uncharacterized protein MIND_01409500 [Mycena indigotica]KAF7288932.1 hypothetical protein MIND_01409500 [Mycena indigotica]